jgi:Z1 domain.
MSSINEKNIAAAVISILANEEEPITRERVEVVAKGVAGLSGYHGDLRNVVTEALIAVETRMGAGVSLVDTARNHDEQWVQKRHDISWVYTSAYETYLRTQGWSSRMVEALSDVTLRILGHLQDPKCNDSVWNRRGLVIGHVQSGKTANYTGVIARAADAGYKFIIVIAGIHNILRKQTQERIDEAFIGMSSEPGKRRPIGVGLYCKNYPGAATLTNIHEDFSRRTAASSGWRINDLTRPIILVIKKNVSTLDALYTWLRELNTSKGDGRITDAPLLLIDDEADNASINTNKGDLDPTRTNEMIRRILSLFTKSCYVGYTATPFANIFINPDAYDEEVREELFPRDFIYCLDPPTSYFGAEKVFLDDASSQQIVRTIIDCEDYIPLAHKKDYDLFALPPSLCKALNVFILARAIRNLRGQASKHCSMMINVSRFVSVQRAVRDVLRERISKIRQAVLANYRMPEEVSSKNVYMQELKSIFDEEYSLAGVSWGDVKSALGGVFDNLQLYVINSKSDEVLDFRKYDSSDKGLTAISVGGMSLSRGLTVEGLTVSYMYRNTKMYDTLLQMGRWFGYRPGYEDLCRVYLSQDSINWYSHIAFAADELTQQVKQMRRDGLSPRQFGLYVRAHPDCLLVTAANKMRCGKKIKLSQNFSEKLVESYTVSVDRKINEDNFHLIEKFWRNGFGGKKADPTCKGVIFRDVDIEEIEDFLVRFRSHSEFSFRKDHIVRYLKAISGFHPVGDVLLISPGGVDESAYRLKCQERSLGKLDGSAWTLNKNRVASKGDEALGLSDEQKSQAVRLAREDNPDHPISDVHYRRVRNKPLLMIHSLKPRGGKVIEWPIAAFGVSFPPGLYGTEIEVDVDEVVANPVLLKQMQEALAYFEEEEELDVRAPAME